MFRNILFTLIFSFLIVFPIYANELPFPKGETITYDIKKFGLTVGEASYTFNGLTEIEGTSAYLLTFTAKALKFFDEEKIYFDPETFYPIIVKRDLNIFGKKEQISERYLHKEGKVVITKFAKGKTSKIVLKKEGPIDNLMCFIYRYRRAGTFKKSELLNMNLPTKDIQIQLIGKKELRISKNIHNTFYMQSIPNQYRIWFKADQTKIPLRIDGALGGLKAKMVLKSYEPKL